MNVYEAVVKRRSIRRFQEKPVPYEVLEKCADAGRLAPTGRNTQSCEFVIVDDGKIMTEIFATLGGTVKAPPEKGGTRPENAPKAYFVIIIDKAREGDPNRRRTTLCDIGAAAENIMLTAVEEGLGCCPVQYFGEDAVKQALNIPEGYDVGLVIMAGYPAEAPVADVATDATASWVDEKLVRHVPKRKLADIVHHNGL